MAEIMLIITIMIAVIIAFLGVIKSRSQWDRDNAWKTDTPLLGVVSPKKKEEKNDE